LEIKFLPGKLSGAWRLGVFVHAKAPRNANTQKKEYCDDGLNFNDLRLTNNCTPLGKMVGKEIDQTKKH
jgi:hypothetical protein